MQSFTCVRCVAVKSDTYCTSMCCHHCSEAANQKQKIQNAQLCMHATWCKASNCLLSRSSNCMQKLAIIISLFHAKMSITNCTSVDHCSDFRCIACSRVHDRTVSHIRYLPEEGLIATLAFDNTLRIFNAIQATLRCTVVNDTGGPFTGMERDPVRSQVCSGPFPCKIRAVPMQGLFPCRAFPMQAALPSQGTSHAQKLVQALCWEFVRYTELANLAETDCTVHTEMPNASPQAWLGFRLTP